MFLRTHGWSQRDYDAADQDTVDLITALDNAHAKRANEQQAQSARESRTASIRSRL